MKTAQITHNRFFTIMALFLIMGLGLIRPQQADAEALDTIYTDEVNMVLGELTQLRVYSLTRLSMTDPDIADVVDADEQEILLIAKNVGQTPLFIWDEHGKRVVMINVSGTELSVIKDRLERLLNGAGINNVKLDINKPEGRVVLTGSVPDKKAILFDDIIAPFDQHVLSLVEEEDIEDLVQIDIQVTELNTTLTKSLGIDWTAGGGNGATGSGGGIKLDYAEDLPDFDGSIGDFFKIGDFRRTSALISTVNALLEEGMGRILSQPKLVVLSGEEASFLIGGEIPIRTTTSTGTSTQENVEFKEYGIGMTITPTIRRNKIDVQINIEISDIDNSNAVGDDVAFVTRSASTQLFLDDGQTIVLAGLIQQRSGELVKKVPFLGSIPVVGLVFRSRSTPSPDSDVELVISLTPHRIDTGLNEDSPRKKMMDSQVPHPTTTKFMSDMSMSGGDDYSSFIPPEMTDYVQNLQQAISEQVVYPQEAKDYGWEGTVKIGLHILSDGTLAYALVKETSGQEIFDDYALNTARETAPFESFPPETDLQELNITIPIVYSLQTN